jgi:hypothetical protein
VPVAALPPIPNEEEGVHMVKAVRSYVKYGLSAFGSVLFLTGGGS